MFAKMMRPMMSYPKPFQSEVEGSSFAGRAVMIGTEPEPEPEIATPESSLVARLQRIKPTTPEIQMMIDNLRAIEFVANQVIAAYETERREELENQSEEIRRRGREQKKVIDALEANQQQLYFQFRSADEYAKNCFEELTSLRKTRISRWDSKAERATLQRKISAAAEAVTQANLERVRASTEHNAAADDVRMATERMGQISDAEIRLRGELSGKIYKDPTTGLPILPR